MDEKSRFYFSILTIRPHKILITYLVCAEIFKMLLRCQKEYHDTIMKRPLFQVPNYLIESRTRLFISGHVERHADRCYCAFPAKLPKTSMVGESQMAHFQERGRKFRPAVVGAWTEHPRRWVLWGGGGQGEQGGDSWVRGEGGWWRALGAQAEQQQRALRPQKGSGRRRVQERGNWNANRDSAGREIHTERGTRAAQRIQRGVCGKGAAAEEEDEHFLGLLMQWSCTYGCWQ